VLCILVVINDDVVEKVTVTTPNVLSSNELQGHPKDREVSGVSANLGVGYDEVESEPRAAKLARLVAGPWWLRGNRQLWLGVPGSVPEP